MGTPKLFVERLLADLNVAYEMPFIALRYFNAAGADPEGAIGRLSSRDSSYSSGD